MKKVIPYMVRHRWVTLLGVVILVVCMELLEHTIIVDYGANVHLVFDLVVYTLLVPAITYIVLWLLGRSESALEQVTYNSDLQTTFSQQLGDALSWDALMQNIVEYPHKVAPSARVTLYVFDTHSLRMKPEAACGPDGQVTLKPAVMINPDSLPVGSLPQLLVQNGGSPSIPDLPSNRFDLPIIRNDQQIGVLKLEYPAGQGPGTDEVRALKSVSPLIALALEGALLQNLAAEQAAASESDRQKIAQNLHDTLAQNISYLRLKLDQLTGENAIREIGVVLQELERMRTTADEAYQQVRDTLDELNPIQAEDLDSMVIKQARFISERAGLALRVNRSGAAYPLPPGTRRQILYIVREALHNVEKHAGARRVLLQFLWLEHELILKITDDGTGFDPLAVSPEGHYGLWIMQQRAQEIGGTLKLTPAEDHGTEVTLWLPRPVYTTGVNDPPAKDAGITAPADTSGTRETSSS